MSAKTQRLSRRTQAGETNPATRYAPAREMVRRLNEQRDGGISELLRAIDVRSAVYCVSDLTAPWGFRVDGSSVPKFHLVLEGACVLTLGKGEALPLACGGLVLLPAGRGH